MVTYYVRQLLLAFLNVLIGFGVASVILEGGVVLLDRLVDPPAGIDIVRWLSDFRAAAVNGTLTAVLAATLWHLVALPGSGRTSDKRMVWVVLLALSAAAGVLFWFLLVPTALSGSVWGFMFCLLLGPCTFWSGTVLFTPAPFKFTPLFASPIRRW